MTSSKTEPMALSKESDLYEPARRYFADLGFAVDAEVRHCDLVALKDDQLIIAELKLGLNFKLLTQAVERQRMTSEVFIVIPAPKRETRQWRNGKQVVKRLGLGLLTVTSSPLGSRAWLQHEPSCHGVQEQSRHDTQLREALLREFSGRLTRQNIGGVTGVEIVTAYRETALCIATLLDMQGQLAPRVVAGYCGDKSASILAKNHYGWFDRVKPGIYTLSPDGKVALQGYPAIVKQARQLISSLDEAKAENEKAGNEKDGKKSVGIKRACNERAGKNYAGIEKAGKNKAGKKKTG